MERMSVVLLLFVVATAGAKVIFPDQLDYTEGEPCPTRSGRPGTCSQSCQQSSSLGKPPTCSITGSTFLVCCEATPDVSPEHQDISPPSNKFGCSDSFPRDIGTQAGGGEKITWPWMALVGSRKTEGGTSWHCAGMLINDQWILSHVDCFFQIRDRVVRLGEYDYNDDSDGAVPEDYDVVDIVIHPNYTRPHAYYDLALVKLDSKVTLKSSISPVCLPWGAESKNSIAGHKAKVLSYGNIIGGNAHNSIQKEIEVTVFPTAQCDQNYSELHQYSVNWPRGMGQETLCAGDAAGGRDACLGDSGGPLVSTDARGTYVAAGIVSQGYGCGHKEYPGLYVNLRYPPYLAWIKEVAFATP